MIEGTTLHTIALKVSEYFRDFLESDFKRQQAPRRRIVLQSPSGFRSGMRLRPYPELDRAIWAVLSKRSGEDLQLTITPRRYTRQVSANLRRVIAEQIQAIPDSAVITVRQRVIEHARATYATAVNNPEEWIDSVRATMAQEIGTQVVRPLIAHLDGPLRSQAYSVIDSLYAAESDLIARVSADLDSVLPQALARLLATGDVSAVAEACEQYITTAGTSAALNTFFDSFVVADAYLEFRDLETYVTTGDGLQLYLYIGALKYGNVQYPAFFVPIEVMTTPDNSGYIVRLVNHLFANRRAIDFVLQELAAGREREWVSPIRDRINYLTPDQSIFEVARVIFRSVANAVDLPNEIELSSNAADASTASVTLSSALHFAAHERAEEALINDYEEIIDLARRGGSAIVDLFERLVGGVLRENPLSIEQDIESQWDALPLVDRMVFDSPIPLNEEQRKIVMATRNPEGRIICVAGPPGTGKSHTITAIAADCAFTHRSCLVLSDKTEALDVVHSKLSDAMSRVRHDRDFPNPVLRLGQQNANFRRLTSTQTLSQVTAYAKAMRANEPQLKAERESTAQTLKDAIQRTTRMLGSVELRDVQDLHANEERLQAAAPQVLEILRRHTQSTALARLKAVAPRLAVASAYLRTLFARQRYSVSALYRRLRMDVTVLAFLRNTAAGGLDIFMHLDKNQLHSVGSILHDYRALRMPLFGYLFRSSAVAALDQQLNEFPVSRTLSLRQDAPAITEVVACATKLKVALEQDKIDDMLHEAYTMLAKKWQPQEAAVAALEMLLALHHVDRAIPKALLESAQDSSASWQAAICFLQHWNQLHEAFGDAPEFDYVGTKDHLERLNTSVMNAHVDACLVDFMRNNRADARALAGVIANREKFPEDKFEAVKQSFPVIIASIREFGEFMPLLPDLFDVVIIDEASQVSVAQALPALLRAKKVVVLGDSKQFSNVKASNASIAMNDKYRANLVQTVAQLAGRNADLLQRLAMFDVKRSILEFCNMAASYSTMLRKHFRSYQELIGYSSENFYDHQLQAIKIRGIPLDDVIRFDLVELAEHRVTRGTNEAEARFILDRLLELVEPEDCATVAVITPFREQQVLLSRILLGHARGRDFEQRLRLRIFTFDSCQGEERDIVFYSMVATLGNDALQYVFPVDVRSASEEVEEKLKVQRLNVGFSRAKEMIWIIHSMPLDQFRGGIGKALQHYHNVLQRGEISGQTDPSSPMETKVLDWLQKTPFVQANINRLEILPQFPIGDYLRQLDVTYKHPAWRVDFLLTYTADAGTVYIVIEYDGLEHHFRPGVHIGNHERYLHEADIERQLTLESYGYRFLRVNRFNLGTDPVVTLSARLYKLVEVAGGQPHSVAIATLQGEAAGLATGTLKPCSRCGTIQAQEEFFDDSLQNGTGGYGRVCRTCKMLSKSGRASGASYAWHGARQRSRKRWR